MKACVSGSLLETLGWKLIKGWKSSFHQSAFSPHQASGSGSSWTPGDSCECRAEGRNFPGDKAEAAHRGLGVERMKQIKNASKKKGPRERKIFMGCLGSISFSFCSFILAINIYLIKKRSPFPP